LGIRFPKSGLIKSSAYTFTSSGSACLLVPVLPPTAGGGQAAPLSLDYQHYSLELGSGQVNYVLLYNKFVREERRTTHTIHS
jgi:hypothetical protein